MTRIWAPGAERAGVNVLKLRSHNVVLATIVLRLIQLLTQIKHTEKRHCVDISKKVKEVGMRGGRWQQGDGRGTCCQRGGESGKEGSLKMFLKQRGHGGWGRGF